MLIESITEAEGVLMSASLWTEVLVEPGPGIVSGLEPTLRELIPLVTTGSNVLFKISEASSSALLRCFCTASTCGGLTSEEEQNFMTLRLVLLLSSEIHLFSELGVGLRGLIADLRAIDNTYLPIALHLGDCCWRFPEQRESAEVEKNVYALLGELVYSYEWEEPMAHEAEGAHIRLPRPTAKSL
eukprot:IDg6843t1